MSAPDAAVAATGIGLLAGLAETTATELAAACQSLQDLAHRLLAHIEDIGGDREYNYALYADLSHAATLTGAAMFKAQTVARHARAGKDTP